MWPHAEEHSLSERAASILREEQPEVQDMVLQGEVCPTWAVSLFFRSFARRRLDDLLCGVREIIMFACSFVEGLCSRAKVVHQQSAPLGNDPLIHGLHVRYQRLYVCRMVCSHWVYRGM